VIDAHLHATDFLQHSITPSDLARVLDDGPADRVVAFGVPVKKKWSVTEPDRPTYYLDDNAPCSGYSLTDELVATLVRGLDDEDRRRVAPLICGFDPTDLLGADHVQTMLSRHQFWRGIGEVFLRHDDLTELTYGENARAGHPALDGVLEICGGRGWPLLFHQDASSAGRSGGREYVGEVVSMLERHPTVVQVWAHAGVSRRVRPHDHVQLLSELLTAHLNLHVDLSWELHGRILEDEASTRAWCELVTRFQDRFVVGSDNFGAVDQQAEQLERWTEFTGGLPVGVRRQVEHENALRLWWH
jgi:hypothetical protein